jgi:4-amino-4-deoxy-L-arabinose transferase-like glycosyltransferase
MMQDTRLDILARGWRGRLFAALITVIAGAPGVFALPPLDRDESRFAEATAQMLETGDFISINYQDQPREKKPIGIHWLQAASVAALSSGEARQIWAYRIPSLLGAALAAAACVWGAGAFFSPRVALAAGCVLAVSMLLSTEAAIAKTDAVLCGAVTLAMAAFAHVYGASRRGAEAGKRVKLLFWLGLAVAILDKGPVGPMVALLTGLALWAWDRQAPWARSLGWAWGLILVAAVVGPWAVAITVQTDGAFWVHAVKGDIAPKLLGGHEGHGLPPGALLLTAPLLIFPAAALLPGAAVAAWRNRAAPGVRFAICWLVPAWLVFEATPTKLVHYPLPTYPALAWLAALAMTEPLRPWGRWSAAALSMVTSVAWACAAVAAAVIYGGGSTTAIGVAAAALALAAGAAGAAVVMSPRPWAAFGGALALGMGFHAVLAGALVPRLSPLWLSRRVAQVLDASHLNPRRGLTPGPVTVAGYAEPSLVFALGTETELGDVSDAAEAISEGRPVVIESRQDAAFHRELADDRLKASPVGSVAGVDYSSGAKDVLAVYRSDSPPQADAGVANGR